MADSFWLYNETDDTTYILDSNVLDLTIGPIERDYNTIDYAGATGGQIRGFGVPGSRKVFFSRQDFAKQSDINFWNAERNTFIKFLTTARVKDLYLYVRNGENTKTLRSLIYPKVIGSDTFNYVNYNSPREAECLMPEGVLQNIVANTDTVAITSAATQVVNVTTNGSTWEAPIQLKYTPTADETSFQVDIGDQFGFKLEKLNFLAGLEIVYDTFDGSMTIDGLDVNPSQFLTAGSIFNLPIGDSALNVTCSGAGSFSYSYNERYV